MGVTHPSLESNQSRAAPPGGLNACPCRFANCSHTPTTTPRSRRSAPRRARRPSARSCPPACGPTCWPRCSTPSRTGPALVVAGDDRAARDLAADLKQFLHPRPVFLYPARGVRYESHLAPPPHLVGLRIAALDALQAELEPEDGRGRDGGRARWRWPRRCPTPSCARTASRSRRAACSTSRRPPPSSWRAATRTWTRSRTAASSRCAATSSTSTRPPRSAPCAASCSTWRWSGSRSSPPSPSARWRRWSAWTSSPRPSWGPSSASWRRWPPPRRPPTAPTSPSCCRWTASASCWTCFLADALVAVAAEEELAPALRDYWEDVTTSFHDADAHHLYVAPERLEQALSERAALSLSSISGDQPHSFRAQAADTAARSLREAEPELEKLVRSGYRTVVAWSRRGEAERAAYNLDRVRAAVPRRQAGAARAGGLLRRGHPARGLSRAQPEARDPARAPAAAPPPRRAAGRARAPARARWPRSPTCARARRWSTRTTA